MGTYYVTKESQEIAGCRLIRYGIGCRWREILGLSHNRQAVEWLVERCNTLELDPSIWRMWCRIFYGNRGNRCERLRVEVRKMEEKREGSRSLSQQEEDALQSIARSDLGGLFKARMDEGFTLLYANDSYYAIHGYTRGQLEQEMHGQAVGLVHPEDVAWVSEHLRRALAENQGTVSFEYRIVRRDGAVVWLLISAGLSPGGRGHGFKRDDSGHHRPQGHGGPAPPE